MSGAPATVARRAWLSLLVVAGVSARVSARVSALHTSPPLVRMPGGRVGASLPLPWLSSSPGSLPRESRARERDLPRCVCVRTRLASSE